MSQARFPFNSLENPETRRLTTGGPTTHRTVYPGCTLYARCNNPQCSVYQQEVCVSLGFGNRFNMAKEIYQCKCPICKTKTQDATNFGYYSTKIYVEGKKCDDSEFIEFRETVGGELIHTFRNEDRDLRFWNFL